MRTLMLLRHAKSSWDDPGLDDFDRPLAPRGQEAAPRVGRHLREAGLRPDLVLCSPAVRARQTWELVGGELGEVEVSFRDELYLASPARMLEVAAAVTRDVTRLMLVGHNPGMEVLAGRLVGDGPKELRKRMEKKFPTSAVALIDFEADDWGSIRERAGQLAGFVRPKDVVA